MDSKPFVVYRSSAGSGKTYTLAKEYLLLSLQYPNYFKHILAVTFTNKATAEMKSRIVDYLHSFANGITNEMSKELMEKLDMNDEQFKERNEQVLSNILHGYSHFAVSTIDAFFQKVIRSFAKETGLSGGFKLELDQSKVLDVVVDNLMEEVGHDVELTQWLVRFVEDKVEEGKSWDIKKDIKRFAQELFQEVYKGKEQELNAVTQDKDYFSKFLKALNEVLNNFEKFMRQVGEEAFVLMDKHDLTTGDFAHGAGGVAGYFDKILYKKEYEPGKRVLTGLDNVETWFAKTSPNKEQIALAVEGGLIQLLNKAVAHYEQHSRPFLSAKVVKKQVYAFGILLDVANKLKDYKDEEGVMLISDAGEFLKKIVEDNDTPFIYEKVGSFYNHFLIDEFQDTSGFQWQNFAPLISNSLAEGHRNLIVGDVKQSIYRWRGGDWSLLQQHAIEDIGKGYSETRNLNDNYRSARKVIEINNLLFEQGAKACAELYKEKLNANVEDVEQQNLIEGAYKDVKQRYPQSKVSKSTFEGYLSFSFIPTKQEINGEEKKWKEVVLERMPRLLESLQDRGVGIRDIAFLVRGKRDAQLVVDYLIDYKNSEKAKQRYSYEVISNESLLLTASNSVNLILSALVYLNNPQDKIALANLVHSYQCSINENIEPDDIFGNEHMEWSLPTELQGQLKTMRKLPLYELVEGLVRLLNLTDHQGEYAYLQGFEDVVLDYVRQGKGDINSFLDWWDENADKQMVKLPDDMQAARVMTIHKSKGLQFKAVIIPFCNWTIDHDTRGNKESRLWIESDKFPYDSIPFLPISYGPSLKETFFDKDYYNEMAQAYMDNFNLLYVAATRAEDYLFTFSHERSKSLSTVSDLLFDVLKTNYEQAGGKWDEINNVFRFGEFSGQMDLTSSARPMIDSSGDFTYMSNLWRDKLVVKYRSRNFFSEPEDQKAKINYGNLIHDLMSRIITTDQLPMALDAMKYEGLIGEQEKVELSAAVMPLFQNDIVSSWFDKKWEVKTEVPVLPTSGEMSRLDRVMINKDQAVVADYKTGLPKNEDHIQVEKYKKLLSEMGYNKVRGYLLYVDKVEVMEV